MKKCPSCKEGKINVTCSMYGSDEPATVTEMDCVICGGDGKLSDEEYQALEEHKADWCTCKDQTPIDFYDDGQHYKLHKHHYRHRTCGKIVQIG